MNDLDGWNDCRDARNDGCPDTPRQVHHHVEAYGSDGIAWLIAFWMWRRYRAERAKTAPPSPPLPAPSHLSSVVAWCLLALLLAALAHG